MCRFSIPVCGWGLRCDCEAKRSTDLTCLLAHELGRRLDVVVGEEDELVGDLLEAKDHAGPDAERAVIVDIDVDALERRGGLHGRGDGGGKCALAGGVPRLNGMD